MKNVKEILDRVKHPDARVRTRMMDWAQRTFRETASELENYADAFSVNERHALTEIMKQCDRLLKTL